MWNYNIFYAELIQEHLYQVYELENPPRELNAEELEHERLASLGSQYYLKCRNLR